MKQYKTYVNPMNYQQCVYCSSNIMDESTRDHVPSKILLDKPFPENLPVVPSCHRCNNSFSSDEEYIAYWFEELLQTYRIEETNTYKKLQRAFKRNPKLKSKILGKNLFGSNELLELDTKKLNNVLIKLAKGHAFFELNNPQYQKPTYSKWSFAHSLTKQEIDNFRKIPSVDNIIASEVGSRSLYEIAQWQIVQEDRYAYLAFETVETIIIRIVLNTLLLYEAHWTR